MAQAVKWSEDLRVSVKTRTWTGRPNFRGVGVPTNDRVTTLLNLCAVQRLRDEQRQLSCIAGPKPPPSSFNDFFVDYSQNPCRKKYSKQGSGTIHCLCSSTCLYSYGSDRALFPVEYLRLQGWGFDTQVPSQSAGKVQQLAGQGMALPCLALIIWSAYLVKGLPMEGESMQ